MNISIIIPTYNRYDSLKQMLQALATQDYPKEQYEVFVVDDGSKDETPSIVNENFPFQLHYIRQANQGATVARNRAAQEATGELLIFLDDDIYVVPGFLDAMACAHQVDRLVAIGNLQPVVRENMSVFERISVESAPKPHLTESRTIIPVHFTNCLTGMFSVKRAHFFEIGQLQDLVGDGRVAWGDVDFGNRAAKLGFQFVCSLNAIGYHDDFSVRDFKLCATRWERTSESAVKLFRAYPEIRPHVPMFDDKEPIAWGKDNAGLIVKKMLRRVMSTRLMIWLLEKWVAFLEKVMPTRRVLHPFYRWVIGGYIFQGYRSGLNKYGK